METLSLWYAQAEVVHQVSISKWLLLWNDTLLPIYLHLIIVIIKGHRNKLIGLLMILISNYELNNHLNVTRREQRVLVTWECRQNASALILAPLTPQKWQHVVSDTFKRY